MSEIYKNYRDNIMDLYDDFYDASESEKQKILTVDLVYLLKDIQRKFSGITKEKLLSCIYRNFPINKPLPVDVVKCICDYLCEEESFKFRRAMYVEIPEEEERAYYKEIFDFSISYIEEGFYRSAMIKYYKDYANDLRNYQVTQMDVEYLVPFWQDMILSFVELGDAFYDIRNLYICFKYLEVDPYANMCLTYIENFWVLQNDKFIMVKNDDYIKAMKKVDVVRSIMVNASKYIKKLTI